MNGSINLTADLGEGFGAYRMADDTAMLDLVSAANIACGFHAGDPRIMERTVRACVERGVSIGAHPGLPDLVGFGRRTLDCTPHEAYTDVLYQLGALSAFVRAHGGRIAHVTPHGQLGHLTRRREDIADAVARAARAFDEEIRVVSREGYLTEAAHRAGLRTGHVGFADRAYGDDGELVSRTLPGAVIDDPDEVVARVVRMARERRVVTTGGRELEIKCDTVLVHGDTPGSVRLARAVAEGLAAAGVAIRPLED
ncbi:LamB/YcsF family protein [Pseudonocardia acaciae]|uniref:LamB/YcsF family protein n=1 Tax=Pseudonocardia acaciae TaxID=551276 RepID=UPI0004913416|nr:5-oxoprolinase subunit PxpA [Pseudonocardia acaciae]